MSSQLASCPQFPSGSTRKGGAVGTPLDRKPSRVRSAEAVDLGPPAQLYVLKSAVRRRFAEKKTVVPHRIIVGPSGLAIADTQFSCKEYPNLDELLETFGLTESDLVLRTT